VNARKRCNPGFLDSILDYAKRAVTPPAIASRGSTLLGNNVYSGIPNLQFMPIQSI